MTKKTPYDQLEQRIEKLEGLMAGENQGARIEVSDIEIAWDPKRGTCTFENLPVAMMWVDTTLAGLMSGMQAMVGTKRFSLALQSEGRKSVEEDWKVVSQFPDFRDGFRAIANIGAVAGWGNWQLLSLDMEKKEAVFRVFDSWEGGYQKALDVYWGSGMLAGKMAGYCSKLFGTNCWANQSASIARGDGYDEFVVTPSERSLEQEIENLLVSDEATRADMAVALEKLQKEMADRKQAEDALRESEVRYRTFFEQGPDGVVVLDPTSTRPLEFNNQACRQLGYSREEFARLRVSDIELKESAEEIRAHIQRISGKGHDEFETLHRTKQGEIRNVLVIAQTMKINRLPVYRCIWRDITKQKQEEEEKKQLELRLQRAEKMEVVGTLAGGVAHDLNNVLSGLVSYPDLILMDLPEDSHLREAVLTIQESGKKAAAIVQDLLTLARRAVAVTEIVNLNDVVNQYLKSAEFGKLKKYLPHARISIDLASDLLNVLGSPVHLSKTIMNLVSNAAESLKDEGVIVISTRNQYIDSPVEGYDEVREGDYAVLSVTDNGVGIEKEDLEKIFEPFYTKKAMGRSGTGLGMAVVWGTVKDHHGYINVESTKGNGSRFTLYIPITRKEAEEGKPLLVDAYMGHGEKILVVDDIAQQREIASELLKRLGYSVDTVPGGEEAVEYMKGNSADLVILDMIMDPGMDGLDAYRKILELSPGQKAIIASGFSETDRVKEAQRLGAGRYVRKPYTIEKIGLAVKAELSR